MEVYNNRVKKNIKKIDTTIYNKLKEINDNGGNFLLNVGSDSNGNIPLASIEVLLEVGEMLKKE